jgi:hypothetical protein
VVEPKLVKTVSNMTVSNENSNLAEGSVKTSSFLQDVIDKQVKTIKMKA